MTRSAAIAVTTTCLLAGVSGWPLDAAEFAEARFGGTVSDSRGEVLPGALVRIVGVSNARRKDVGEIKDGSLTGPDGRYELNLHFQPGRDPVRCRLRFEIRGYIATNLEVTVPPGETLHAGLNVVLSPGQVLSGRVGEGHYSEWELKRTPALRDRIYALTVTGSGFEEHIATDPGGHFEIYVPPGSYRLSSYVGLTPVELAGIPAGTTGLVLDRPVFDWTPAAIGKAFDGFWEHMDRNYSYFFLKTNVSWMELGTRFRPEALKAGNPVELGGVLQRMLEPLQDLHIWIETPETVLPTHPSRYTYNGNREVVIRQLRDTETFGDFALVGRTRDEGFGCLLMLRQSRATPERVRGAVAAIRGLRDAPGFIVDLRLANGGSEPLAQELAREFCGEEVVYARQRYRSGPGHADLGREGQRVLPAGESPFTKPVVCLTGPGAVSSGEGFVLMLKALPHVTTLGGRTRGASGNPKPFLLEGTGVKVTYSRWVSMEPDGTIIEGRGVKPEVWVEEPAEAYRDADPIFERALKLLKERITSRSDR